MYICEYIRFRSASWMVWEGVLGVFWGCLGGSWGGLGASWGGLGGVLGGLGCKGLPLDPRGDPPKGGQLDPSWPKLGPSCGHVGPKLAQVGLKMPIKRKSTCMPKLGRCWCWFFIDVWSIFGRFWKDFGGHVGRQDASENDVKFGWISDHFFIDFLHMLTSPNHWILQTVHVELAFLRFC